MNILMIVGSLRKESLNKTLAKAITNAGVDGMDFEMADITAIPLYNGDMEASFPTEVSLLKEKIKAADGIIVVTPEYNRSIPGVLKNVIDWTSRPYGQSAWKGKPATIAGATGSHVGTAAAQGHLRDLLSLLSTHLMAQPEMYIGSFADRFDIEGKVKDEKTKDLIKAWLEAFKTHIALFKK